MMGVILGMGMNGLNVIIIKKFFEQVGKEVEEWGKIEGC